MVKESSMESKHMSEQKQPEEQMDKLEVLHVLKDKIVSQLRAKEYGDYSKTELLLLAGCIDDVWHEAFVSLRKRMV